MLASCCAFRHYLWAALLAGLLLPGQSARSRGPAWVDHGEGVGEECTIGVASGCATPDGRPLLWKTRDSESPDNECYYNSSYAHGFVAVVNANGGPDSEAWMGVNVCGFCILNADSEDLDRQETFRGNGEFMRDALGACCSVAEFQALLDSTNTIRDTHASFGVIDSTGAAFIFEASPDTYWSYDASQASGGFIVRANFACHDTAGTGIADRPGAHRYLRSQQLLTDLVADSNLTCAGLLSRQMRDFSNHAGTPIPVPCYACGSPDSLHGFLSSYWSICRNISVSAAIIHGVQTTAKTWEPATLTTLWVLLGNPAATIAFPLWPVGPAPALADGDSTAPLCDRARVIQGEIFPGTPSPHLVDSFRLLDGNGGGIWAVLHPAEGDLVAGMETRLQQWRAAPPSWPEMLAVEDLLARLVYDRLSQVTATSEGPRADTAPASLLAPSRPNPFNAGTEIVYDLPRAMRVTLEVYDARGRRVAVLVDSRQDAGIHHQLWHGRNDHGRELPSGVYFCRLVADGRVETRNMTVVR